jgi:hypothetical protein
MTKIGQMLCRLGRHRWEYLIFPDDDLVRWCPRCRRPRALTIIPARRLEGPKEATWVPAGTAVPPADVVHLVANVPDGTIDRPVAPDLDHDALSAAAGMLAAIASADDQGFRVLAKHSDPKQLTFALCFLVLDALAERGTDLRSYCDDLFERLARRRE